MGIFDNLFGPSAEKIEEERKRQEEKHNRRIECINQNNTTFQESRKKVLKDVKDSYDQEVQRKEKQDEVFINKQAEMIATHNSLLEQALTENNSQLTKLQEDINIEKANEKSRHLKEKADMINNHAEQILKAENALATLEMKSEKRINEENKLILKKEEIIIGERKCMAEESTKNEESRMEQRLALENEKNSIALTTNRMITDFEVQNLKLDKAHQSAMTILIDAHKKDEGKFSDDQNLRSVRDTGNSIKSRVNSLFQKFDVPFSMNNENGLKTAAQRAKVSIQMLEEDLNSLKTSLGNLQQNEKRESLVKTITQHLSCFENHLTRFDGIVKDREYVKLETAHGLMNCLRDMVAEINKTVETIDEIRPIFQNEGYFMREGIQVVKSLGEISNPINNIASSSAELKNLDKCE